MKQVSSLRARVVLGVGGGIAAYKSASLLRLLVKSGHDVTVIPTPVATQFVGLATWEALSGNPVTTSVFEDVAQVRHVRLGQDADIVVVAPATADFLAKSASGQGDNLLLATLLVAKCPVILAPAMHTQMWENPATQANVALLRERGIYVIEPAVGPLTGADSGAGRLPEPEELFEIVAQHLSKQHSRQDLAGLRILISAGGTQEPIDPVRFLGNRSSGKQGIALALTARDRGGEVVVVAANISEPIPDGVELVKVSTAQEMEAAMVSRAARCDVVVMTAAVADYRPVAVEDIKIKKEASDRLSLELVRNNDILLELVKNRAPGQVIIGFAAETGDANMDATAMGQEKAVRKNADYLVVNDVSGGQVFGQDNNSIIVVNARGQIQAETSGRKAEVADVIWDVVAGGLPRD